MSAVTAASLQHSPQRRRVPWPFAATMLCASLLGIGLAGLSMVIQFLFAPHYPIWSLLVIGVDGVIIWALATYRRDAL